MGLWEYLNRLLAEEPVVKVVQLSPNLAESSVAVGDRVRILPDASTDERGFTGKIGTVYGQTTPSSTDPEIIGTLTKDYAVSVYLDDVEEQFWFPEHLLELVDHGAGATVTLDGVDKEWVRKADGTWEERQRS